MNETVNIGRTIARERRRAGVTQEALAAHLGVSKAAVSKWELGQSLPDVSLLPRIAAYFSLTLDELLTGAANSPRRNPPHSMLKSMRWGSATFRRRTSACARLWRSTTRMRTC